MERKLEIILVEDEPAICKEYGELISDSKDLILVGFTNNSTKAVELIRELLPDVVILDLELHQGGGNGLLVLKELQSMSLAKKPYVLITTNNSSSYTYESARALGADFIMSKHQDGYSAKGVLDFLRIMSSAIKSSRVSASVTNNTTETPEQHQRRITKLIMRELDFVGISPKSKGYIYLTDAIMLMIKSPTQSICSVIADKHSKSEPSVERAMQNAINRAWKTSNTEDLYAHYTAQIHSEKGAPTITEFICYYANKLKTEY